MKKYDERSVIASLKKVANVTVKTTGIGYNVIEIKEDDRNKLGIHSWGKLDYLTHYCNYTVIFRK